MKDVRLPMAGIWPKTRRMELNAKLSGRGRSCGCQHGSISPGRTTIPSRSKRTPVNKHGCFTSVLLKPKRENVNGRATRKPPGLSSRKAQVWDSVSLKELEAVSPGANSKTLL